MSSQLYILKVSKYKVKEFKKQCHWSNNINTVDLEEDASSKHISELFVVSKSCNLKYELTKHSNETLTSNNIKHIVS